MFQKTIASGLAPNYFIDDVLLAVKTLFNPFVWKEGKGLGFIENKFKKYFKIKNVYCFNSGRSALAVGLKALNLPKESEVLLQAFSCVVVANSINYAGLKPVFVDIGKNNFGLDIDDLQKKITSKTKVIITQNLFGIPDDYKKILQLVKKHKLILIEDCAQSLGSSYKGKKLGLFGKFAFFSFGREKVISSTFGGVLITSDDILAANIENIYEKIAFPGSFWIFKQIFHPIAFSIIIPTYFMLKVGKFSIGKAILFSLQKLRLIDYPVSESEKKGTFNDSFIRKLPNALAILANHQFKKLEKFNEKRIKHAQYYFNKLKFIKDVQLPEIDKDYQPIFLRVPLRSDNAKQLDNFVYKRNIFLSNWYDNIIAPGDVDLKVVGYKKCPNAEKAVKTVVNLPTYPKMTIKDTQRVVECILEFYAGARPPRAHT